MGRFSLKVKSSGGRVCVGKESQNRQYKKLRLQLDKKQDV